MQIRTPADDVAVLNADNDPHTTLEHELLVSMFLDEHDDDKDEQREAA